MQLLFQEERETRGTFRFSEIVPEGILEEPKVGTIYVRKATLAMLGWKQGQTLAVTLEVRDGGEA